MRIQRRAARVVKIGNVAIGGTHPVLIQSMTKTRTCDVENTVRQIQSLERHGCEIVRLAVKDIADARAFKRIKPHVRIPLVADIHFDRRLALASIESGADKIRLNPGNIHKREYVREIISALKSAKIPLRIGVNSGSVPDVKRFRDVNASSAAGPAAAALTAAALKYIAMVEKCGFYDIVVSLKASSVLDTIAAYRLTASRCEYPLHLGVTATGAPYGGALKSAVALGALLLGGIGDTLRVSLTDAPRREVYAAQRILESLELRSFGPQIVSCPTCGRCEVELVRLVGELEGRIRRAPRGNFKRPVKIAVMGCVVNGPGEAREADIGIAFGRKEGLLFKNGGVVKKVPASQCINTLLEELQKEGAS